jgi:hypothetical protein
MLSTRCFFKEVNFHLGVLQVTMLVYAGGKGRSYEALWIVGDVLSLDLGTWPRGSYYFIYKAYVCSFLPAFFCSLSSTARLQHPLFSHSHLSSIVVLSLPCFIFLSFWFSFFLFLPVFWFLFFGTTFTSQNSIYEEIKSRLKLVNVLLLFDAEYFVFQFAIQKYKD